MKHFWNCFLLITLFISCTSKKNTRELSSFIPTDASIVLTIHNPENLKTNLNNNDLLKTFIGNQQLETLKTQLSLIDSLHIDNYSLLSFKDSSNYVFATKLIRDSLALDSLKIKSLKNSKLIDDYLVLASNPSMIEDVINTKTNPIASLTNTTTKELSFVLNNHNTLSQQFFINDALKPISLASTLQFDTDISQNSVLLNGIATISDSLQHITSIFKNTIPQEQQLSRITPANSDGFLSFTFDDVATITENLNRFNSNDSIPESSLFDFVSEVGVIYEGTIRAVVIRTIDKSATLEVLQDQQQLIETYRGIPIYTFQNTDLFSKTFTPLISNTPTTMYCVIDDFMVFSNSMDLFQTIISSFQNNTTLEDRAHYKELEETLFDEASLTTVITGALFNKNSSAINKTIAVNTKNMKHIALQLATEADFAHINIHTKKSKATVYENTISEQFNITLDHELITAPQFVKNHKTKQREIAVQDINNTLYLISNEGKILWKKQLDNVILGKIEQIDMYQNGRLQLAFATSNRVYVLDRNGKDVDPFPIKFNETITQPLAVFDYDKKRDYRLVVTQDKYIHMYDGVGSKKRGFEFKQANSTILATPKHIRIGSKDYVTFKTKDQLYILTRKGEPRVTPKTNYTYSKQNVFLYNKQFITTTASGDLVTINTNGTTASRAKNLENPHAITSTTKTLVTLSGNSLTIRDKTIELDFGEYTAPEIFYKSDKLYIALTDLQTQKVYVYDSQAKLLPKFPIYGTSKIDFNNIDKDRALEFVTKSGSNGVIVYEIN